MEEIMFIYSVRASTLRFVAVLILCVVGLGVLLGMTGADATFASVDGREINYGGIRENDERIAFIEQFGLKVNPEAKTEETLSLPENFDRVINGYNEIQKRQGLDLSRYKNKRVTHFAYEVTNYSFDGVVYVNLYVYRGKVIACDISSLSKDGFILPLTEIDPKNLKA
jgi:hypothetical protein